jgi:hypothetical protein
MLRPGPETRPHDPAVTPAGERERSSAKRAAQGHRDTGVRGPGLKDLPPPLGELHVVVAGSLVGKPDEEARRDSRRRRLATTRARGGAREVGARGGSSDCRRPRRFPRRRGWLANDGVAAGEEGRNDDAEAENEKADGDQHEAPRNGVVRRLLANYEWKVGGGGRATSHGARTHDRPPGRSGRDPVRARRRRAAVRRAGVGKQSAGPSGQLRVDENKLGTDHGHALHLFIRLRPSPSKEG